MHDHGTNALPPQGHYGTVNPTDTATIIHDDSNPFRGHSIESCRGPVMTTRSADGDDDDDDDYFGFLSSQQSQLQFILPYVKDLATSTRIIDPAPIPVPLIKRTTSRVTTHSHTLLLPRYPSLPCRRLRLHPKL